MARQSVVLQDGPLNLTRKVEGCSGTVVVRERVLDAGDYGQTFAAERFVKPLLPPNVNMPRLRSVVDRPLRRRAVFDFIPSVPIDWADSKVVSALVEALATIHSIAGNALGRVATPDGGHDVNRFIARIIKAELERAPISVLPHAAERDRLWRALVRHLNFSAGEICLCHGDVHPGNFLLDQSERLWVIDWEAARWRTAESDFNQFLASWSAELCERTFAAYCSRRGLDLATFRKRVTLFSALWRIRTFNFEVNVRSMSLDSQYHHFQEFLAHVEVLE